MAMSTHQPRPCMLAHQNPLSPSIGFISLASLNGMEKPIPSFQAFVRANAPIPQINPSKPLPPVPGRRRPSSSVYSTKASALFAPIETGGRVPSTEFFLQPVKYSYSNPNLLEPQPEMMALLETKTYNPSIIESYISPGPSPSPKKTSVLPVLEPRTYSPSKSVGSNAQQRGSGEMHIAPSRMAQLSAQSPPQQQHSPDLYIHPLDDLASSPTEEEAKFIHEEASFHAPLLEHELIAKTQEWSHNRQISQEKALIALGMDSHRLQDESNHRKHHHLFSAKVHYHTPPRQWRLSDVTTPELGQSPSSIRSSSRGSLASSVTSEEPIADTQLFAKDYHKLLMDRYRKEQEDLISEDSTRAEMRMVPAPLFFKRSSRHRRGSSGKGDELCHNRLPDSGSAHKGAQPVHIPSLIGRDHRLGTDGIICSKTRDSTKAPRLKTQTKNSSSSLFVRKPSRAETSPAPAKPVDRSLDGSRRPSGNTRLLTSPDMRLSPLHHSPITTNSVQSHIYSPQGTNTSTVSALHSPGRRGPQVSMLSQTSPNRAQYFKPPTSRYYASPTTPSQSSSPLSARLNTALEKAREGLTHLAARGDGSSDGEAGWDTATQRRWGRSGGVGVKSSKSDQRKDLLKKSIRVVGQVDPNAVAMAQTLGAVDLGRIAGGGGGVVGTMLAGDGISVNDFGA